MAISLNALIPLLVWVCSSPYCRSKWASALKRWIINTQPVSLQLWLLMESGLMKSPCFNDKLVYQKVNLVKKKIYSPLALAVVRLILTVRILFYYYYSFWIFFFCTPYFYSSFSLKRWYYRFIDGSHTFVTYKLFFKSLKLKHLVYANTQIRVIILGMFVIKYN